MNDALISMKPVYVKKILEGVKQVEVRSRRVTLSQGARLWIYATLPKACLEAVAIIESVEFDSPTLVWERYQNKIGTSFPTFCSYVNGSELVSAISLTQVRKLIPSIPLDILRSQFDGFQPPQFIKYIDRSNPIFLFLEKNYKKATFEPNVRRP